MLRDLIYLRPRYISYIFRIPKTIKNWGDYFLDYFSIWINKDPIYRMRNGHQFFIRPKSADRGIITTICITDDYHLHKLALPQEATVVDIGAQIGVFSISIAEKAGKIWAFEPEHENYKYLLKNIQLNQLQGKICAYNMAVTSGKEMVRLYRSKHNTGGHSLIFKKSGLYEEVKTMGLVDIFNENNLRGIDLLKIDAEGSEYEILYNLPPEYLRKITNIYLEYHNLDNGTRNGKCLNDYLNLHGFKSVLIREYIYAKQN